MISSPPTISDDVSFIHARRYLTYSEKQLHLEGIFLFDLRVAAQPLVYTTRLALCETLQLPHTRNASASGRPSPLRTTRHRTHRFGRSSISRHSVESRYENLWTAWTMSTHYCIPSNTRLQQTSHPCAPCNIHSFGRNVRNGLEDTTFGRDSGPLRTRTQDPRAPQSCLAHKVL